ncbi:hypothetical protein [Streptomyces sp. HB2AG]|uniref:hypothetical protein n=1 Tax=Streptomyces sp. HB2AG TaxID=2983400 RepID=UPI0022AB357D|nr:hypothetical protein [Streptomyces sp. HB2AG]MCZ2525561.1 hypothetical protein [Streptomyces sp. HB2AG]
MLVWETIVFAAAGLVVGLTAARLLPGRLPRRPLTLGTGACAGVLGGYVTRTVLDGPGHLPVVLLGAVLVSAALVSLLVRSRPPVAGRARTDAARRPRPVRARQVRTPIA